MKLSDYKRDFYDFSGKASEVTRNLAFAGIALAWVFKVEGDPVPHLPTELLLPVALLASGLFVDCLHYVVASLIWGNFHLYHERRLAKPTDDPQLKHSRWLDRPILALFWFKIFLVAAAYVWMLKYLWLVWAESTS